MKSAALLLAGVLMAPATVVAQGVPPALGAPAPPVETFDILVSARQTIGAPAGTPLTGAELEAHTTRVSGVLRCPVCQGLSVADSPATMAQNMRAQVRELLHAGYTDDQVIAYFESAYGEFVRLAPAFRGVNRVVWLAPLAGLLLGLTVVALALRRGRTVLPGARPVGVGEASPDESPDEDALPTDPGLAGYVLRVRAEAYGWPGGVRPAEPSSTEPS